MFSVKKAQVQIFGILICLLASTFSLHATAQFRSTQTELFADRKPIREFLREFAANQSIDIYVDAAVEGTVSGRFNGPPKQILDNLSKTHRFIWYFESGVLQIVSDVELTTELIMLPDVDPNSLRLSLNRLGLLDKKFPLVMLPKEGTVKVTGPRRYVDMIKQALRSMNFSESGVGSRSEAKVFVLRYVWAADTRIAQGNTQTVVPGVASILQSLYAKDAVATPQRGRTGISVVAPSKSVAIKGGRESSDVTPSLKDTMPDPFASNSSNQANGPRAPSIVADVRQNAVVIRDTAERMGIYERLIAQLDRPGGLIEIDVQIIEVTTENVDQLGIDWRVRTPRADLQVGQGPFPSLSADSFRNPRNPGLDALGRATSFTGGSFTLLAGNAVNEFLLRVNALVDCGQARVEASPRILTMANVQAVIENKEEINVRVAGNLEANLFSISAGTSMRVTPMFTKLGAANAVSMVIDLEDGSISDRQVDSIPVVKRSNINTQATVREGESLLIAGYTKEISSDSSNGVPGLSDLPVVGSLFKNTSKRRIKVERLILLTPRSVS